MSSLIINWRIGSWFLQVEPPRYWRNGWGSLRRVPGRGKHEPFCAFYQGGGYLLLALILIAALVGWVAA